MRQAKFVTLLSRVTMWRRRVANGVVMGESVTEGDLVAVPLNGGDAYAVGVVARRASSGLLLAYFSGKKFSGVPTVTAAKFDPEESVWITRVGDLGLIEGTWKPIGSLPGWDRRQWPVPIFGRFEELSGRYFRSKYDDELTYKGQALSTEEVVRQLPVDSVAGAEFAELRLERLLAAEPIQAV